MTLGTESITIEQALMAIANGICEVTSNFSSDAYDVLQELILEVRTHPDWHGVDEYYEMFKANPSCSHYALLHGAMTVYQDEVKNV